MEGSLLFQWCQFCPAMSQTEKHANIQSEQSSFNFVGSGVVTQLRLWLFHFERELIDNYCDYEHVIGQGTVTLTSLVSQPPFSQFIFSVCSLLVGFIHKFSRWVSRSLSTRPKRRSDVWEKGCVAFTENNWNHTAQLKTFFNLRIFRHGFVWFGWIFVLPPRTQAVWSWNHFRFCTADPFSLSSKFCAVHNASLGSSSSFIPPLCHYQQYHEIFRRVTPIFYG